RDHSASPAAPASSPPAIPPARKNQTPSSQTAARSPCDQRTRSIPPASAAASRSLSIWHVPDPLPEQQPADSRWERSFESWPITSFQSLDVFQQRPQILRRK